MAMAVTCEIGQTFLWTVTSITDLIRGFPQLLFPMQALRFSALVSFGAELQEVSPEQDSSAKAGWDL